MSQDIKDQMEARVLRVTQFLNALPNSPERHEAMLLIGYLQNAIANGEDFIGDSTQSRTRLDDASAH